MNWELYSSEFRARAIAAEQPPEYVVRCLEYAEALWKRGFPVIYDLNHLSELLGYDRDYVLSCSYAAERAYREFTVPKKTGNRRHISEPLPSLKEIQRWILSNILYSENESRFAKGFVRGRGIKENARFHRAQPIVLSLDIQNFFPSLSRLRVYRLFRSFGYSPAVSGTLAHLCTLRGALPQGAPTSPALSNLLMRQVDKRLGGYALAMGARYTRYADD